LTSLREPRLLGHVVREQLIVPHEPCVQLRNRLGRQLSQAEIFGPVHCQILKLIEGTVLGHASCVLQLQKCHLKILYFHIRSIQSHGRKARVSPAAWRHGWRDQLAKEPFVAGGPACLHAFLFLVEQLGSRVGSKISDVVVPCDFNQDLVTVVKHQLVIRLLVAVFGPVEPSILGSLINVA